MKKFMITCLTVLATVSVIGASAAGFILYHKFAPSKNMADQSLWYGVSGDETAVILDNEKEEGVTGKMVNGQVYLPLSWVNQKLNERFYWDAENHQLIYALPDSIVYADSASLGSTGDPLILEQEDEVWLLSGLVASYTNIRVSVFEENAERVWIDTVWESEAVSEVKKECPVRIRGGVKSDVLTNVPKGGTVVVLETMENWSRVRTEDGHLGYVRNRFLGETESRPLLSTFQEPEYTNISLEEPIVMVWHQVTQPAANQKMEELIANTKGVNVIAPTWFMLTDNEGSYDSLTSQEYVNKAHQMGMQVWAVLDNFNRGSNVQSEVLFASTKARKQLISNLINEVLKYGIDGINLDIEGIKPEAGPHYVQFIRELSVDCRKNGIILSVDSYVPSAYTSFYNRAEQGKVADYVVMMGYDEHYAGGEPGSVASLGYEKKGIEDTLKEVPKEKLISAIPFYTRIWKEENGKVTSDAMGIAKAQKWIEENQVELYWQEDLGQNYGELVRDGVPYTVWMEDARSLELKMDLIRDYDLAGVACWKLGFEPGEIWDIVKLP